jgi:NAD(P)-dependent dehydrogenase (short-subunit alcohol dehydrogenase family)
MVAAVVKRFGRIDGLVNNAGLYPTTPLLELSEQEWDQVLDTNLKGPFMCTQAAAREMIARGVKGQIVNISSTASLIARPGTVHYASSKAGLNALTRVLAIELAPHGIRVNCVLPSDHDGGVRAKRSLSVNTGPSWQGPLVEEIPAMLPGRSPT